MFFLVTCPRVGFLIGNFISLQTYEYLGCYPGKQTFLDSHEMFSSASVVFTAMVYAKLMIFRALITVPSLDRHILA